jgi:hypothetical protein
VNAVETQPDVRGPSAAVEGMAGEPHDRRRVIDAQMVAFASKPHFPGRLGCLCRPRRAHDCDHRALIVVIRSPAPVRTQWAICPLMAARSGPDQQCTS